MPINEKRPWLICYDIADPRRLGRVHRFLTTRSIPMQYSVFFAQVRSSELDSILAGLAGLIDEKEDDIRIYPLAAQNASNYLGNTILPSDVEVIQSHQPVFKNPDQ